MEINVIKIPIQSYIPFWGTYFPIYLLTLYFGRFCVHFSLVLGCMLANKSP